MRETQRVPKLAYSLGTILVVDDDHQRRALTHAVLARAGYATLLATSARDALHLARSGPVDLVLGDGDIAARWQTVANALAEVIPNARLLIRSSHAITGVAYIRKPSPPALLLAMITAVIAAGDRFTLSSAVIAS